MAIGVGGADAVDAMTGTPWELKAPNVVGELSSITSFYPELNEKCRCPSDWRIERLGYDEGFDPLSDRKAHSQGKVEFITFLDLLTRIPGWNRKDIGILWTRRL